MNNLMRRVIIGLVKSPAVSGSPKIPDLLMTSKTADFDFRLSDIGMTRLRWSKFTNSYVDERLQFFIERISDMKRKHSGDTLAYTPPRKIYRGTKSYKEPCILGVTFRFGHKRLETTNNMLVVSRVSSFDKTAFLDAIMITRVARMIQEVIGEEISIDWYTRVAQLTAPHACVALEWAGVLKKVADGDYPMSKAINKHYYSYIDPPAGCKAGAINNTLKNYFRMTDNWKGYKTVTSFWENRHGDPNRILTRENCSFYGDDTDFRDLPLVGRKHDGKDMEFEDGE